MTQMFCYILMRHLVCRIDLNLYIAIEIYLDLLMFSATGHFVISAIIPNMKLLFLLVTCHLAFSHFSIVLHLGYEEGL